MKYTPDETEVHPCVIVGSDRMGNEIMEQCEENDLGIACWALYFHANEGGLVHVKDFDTKEQAEYGEGLLRVFIEALGFEMLDGPQDKGEEGCLV